MEEQLPKLTVKRIFWVKKFKVLSAVEIRTSFKSVVDEFPKFFLNSYPLKKTCVVYSRILHEILLHLFLQFLEMLFAFWRKTILSIV